VPAAAATTPLELVERVYSRLVQRVAQVRPVVRRPLTLTEKLLLGHLQTPATHTLARGEDDIALHPDRLAMPDSSAQTALLQFMTADLDKVPLEATVHCDHLVQVQHGAAPDLLAAREQLAEVYEFLERACARYGIGFWEPGSGIIHQVVLENYAFPGCLLVGTDSHTQNGGGLGMLACGVGGAEAVDVMAGLPWTVRMPRVIGVHLSGALCGWATPKDVILALTGILGVDGATGAVLEYLGPGAATLSATGKATICNMGTETGATSSVFPYDDAMSQYLLSTQREGVDRLARRHQENLRPDPEVEGDPSRFYDRLIELDLDTLEPQIAGPTRPDRVRPLNRVREEALSADYPLEITNALIGSCTNSSYEDVARAAHVARQAHAAGARARVPLLISPGSQRALATMARDGILADLEAIGATVLASACGPCIGQWRRADGLAGTPNTIISSFNRNFPRRNDGAVQTHSFLASPTTVVLAALAGRLDFEPGVLPGVGELEPPDTPALPAAGWEPGDQGFRRPPPEGSGIEVSVAPDSHRLQLIERFPPRAQADFVGMPVLLRVDGRCTTDHISPAGPWLHVRGHLERLSENIFLGADNAFSDVEGTGVDQLDGARKPLPVIARHYRERGLGWIVVGGENYGEGSSREHAAMSPRFMGASAVLAASFARIHEANLKKQAVLPLTFDDPTDRALINAGSRIDLLDPADIAPRVPVRLRLADSGGGDWQVIAHHTLNDEQIRWLWAGSALNTLAHRAPDLQEAGS
jgi:aconitate hydratase